MRGICNIHHNERKDTENERLHSDASLYQKFVRLAHVSRSVMEDAFDGDLIVRIVASTAKTPVFRPESGR